MHGRGEWKRKRDTCERESIEKKEEREEIWQKGRKEGRKWYQILDARSQRMDVRNTKTLEGVERRGAQVNTHNCTYIEECISLVSSALKKSCSSLSCEFLATGVILSL